LTYNDAKVRKESAENALENATVALKKACDRVRDFLFIGGNDSGR
jgi:hypothetical protein